MISGWFPLQFPSFEVCTTGPPIHPRAPAALGPPCLHWPRQQGNATRPGLTSKPPEQRGGWAKKCGNKFLIVVDCGWFTGKIYRKNRDWTKKNLGKRWIYLENVGLKPNKHLGQPVNDGWFTGKLWGLKQENRSINWQQSTGIEMLPENIFLFTTYTSYSRRDIPSLL